MSVVVIDASANELPATPLDDSCEDPIGVDSVVTSYQRNETYGVPITENIGMDATREYDLDGLSVRMPYDASRAISVPNPIST
jgi:hypothetical protein